MRTVPLCLPSEGPQNGSKKTNPFGYAPKWDSEDLDGQLKYLQNYRFLVPWPNPGRWTGGLGKFHQAHRVRRLLFQFGHLPRRVTDSPVCTPRVFDCFGFKAKRSERRLLSQDLRSCIYPCNNRCAQTVFLAPLDDCY